MAIDATTRPRRSRSPLSHAQAGVAGSAGRVAGATAGVLAMAGSVAACLWVVLAAAERRSFLSRPARIAFVPWIVGPLEHRLPSLTSDTVTLRTEFTAALGALFVCWLLAWWLAPRLRLEWIVATLVLVHAAFLLGPPLSLTDVFNYLHYSRLGALYGHNPYADLPLVAPQDPAYRLTNWHHLPSPYGPLFTLGGYALAPLPVPAAYWAWKGVVALSSLALLALVGLLASRLGRDPRRALAFAGLNPLVLVYGLGGQHNDVLMLLCAIGAIALLVRGRRPAASPAWDAGGGAAVVAGVAFKLSLLGLAPLVVLGARRRAAALGGALAGTAAAVLVTERTFGGRLPATSLQGRLVTPLSAPNLAGLLAGAGGASPGVRTAAQAVLAVAVAAACAAVATRRAWLIPAAGAVMLVTVLSLAWTVPWYVWWLLPFAALARGRALKAAAVAVTVALALGAIPQSVQMIHGLGYYPTRTATGRANHLFFEHLVK
jgi:hypothetical protein